MKQVTNINPVEITHLKANMECNDNIIKIHKAIPNPDMQDPIERRFCLASMLPDVCDVISVKLEQSNLEDSDYLTNDVTGASKLYTLMHSLDRDLFGGTGLNRGTFYGVNWSQHPFHITSEAVGYLGLLFTPFSVYNGVPQSYSGSVLVLCDEEYDKMGIPGGYGVIITNSDHGQVRLLIGKTSIAKGVAASQKTIQAIGVHIPKAYRKYDIIISESDIKISPLKPGIYGGSFGVTNINPHTIRGQKVSLGFEFWQMIKPHQDVLSLLKSTVLKSKLPDCTEMITSIETQRQLYAYQNNEDYQPLELYSKIQEALIVLGSKYPWVAHELEKVVANYILNSKFQGTEYRLVLVVNDNIRNAFHHKETGEPKYMGGKYPITAGIMKLHGNGQVGPYIVLAKSTADRFNIDADGDSAFLCNTQNPVFQKIIDLDLVKPSRDINIPTKEKYKLPVSIENIAKTAWKIFTSSYLIGSLTVNYYLSEIATDSMNSKIDLSLFYQGIERVIKSAKHDMDLSFLNTMDYDLMKQLKELFAMPYLRNTKQQLLKHINQGIVDDIKTVTINKIKNPAHYMENYYNAQLERISLEIEKLRINKSSLSSFADKIGLSIIPEDLEDILNHEVKDIHAIMNLWVAIGKGNISPRLGVKTISQASSCFTTIAAREAMRSYLSRSTSNGGFAIHFGYGKLGSIFGSELKYTVSENKHRLIRLWTSDIKQVDFELAISLVSDNGTFRCKDCKFTISDATDITLNNSTVITAFPYMKKDGTYSSSIWALIKT